MSTYVERVKATDELVDELARYLSTQRDELTYLEEGVLTLALQTLNHVRAKIHYSAGDYLRRVNVKADGRIEVFRG